MNTARTARTAKSPRKQESRGMGGWGGWGWGGGDQPVPGEHQEAGAKEKWIKLRRRERRGQSRQSRRKVSPRPSPALPLGCCGDAPPPAGWLGWGFPGFCSSWNVPSAFLMWALYMLFPACSPSPPLLCASHQAWLTLPHPSNIFLSQPPAFSTAAALHSCVSQTQHRLQSSRPRVGGLEITQVQSWKSGMSWTG